MTHLVALVALVTGVAGKSQADLPVAVSRAANKHQTNTQAVSPGTLPPPTHQGFRALKHWWWNDAKGLRQCERRSGCIEMTTADKVHAIQQKFKVQQDSEFLEFMLMVRRHSRDNFCPKYQADVKAVLGYLKQELRAQRVLAARALPAPPLPELHVGETVNIIGNTYSKGKQATLEQWDPIKDKWLVRFSTGRGRYLEREFLEPMRKYAGSAETPQEVNDESERVYETSSTEPSHKTAASTGTQSKTAVQKSLLQASDKTLDTSAVDGQASCLTQKNLSTDEFKKPVVCQTPNLNDGDAMEFTIR